VAKKPKKSKKTKEVTEELERSLAKDLHTTMVNYFGLNKRMQVNVLYSAGYGYKDIAEIVDTSPEYAMKCVQLYRKEPKMRQRVLEITSKLPEWFRMSRQAVLPVLAEAQNKALGIYLDDPQLLIDRPALAKQVAQQAGVQADEEVPQRQTINIGELQAIMVTMTDDSGQVGSKARAWKEQQRLEKAKQIEGDIVDVEPEDSDG